MIYVLRLVHIIGGVFWVGSVMFVTILLSPSLKALGPAGGPVMNQLVQVRKMPVILMTTSIVTIIAGLWLLMIDSASSSDWMRSGKGMTYSTGGALAIIAVIIGMSVIVPATKRMAALGGAVAARGGPPTSQEGAEMQKLQARMGAASKIVMTLLILTTAAMALARYIQ